MSTTMTTMNIALRTLRSAPTTCPSAHPLSFAPPAPRAFPNPPL